MKVIMIGEDALDKLIEHTLLMIKSRGPASHAISEDEPITFRSVNYEIRQLQDEIKKQPL